MQPTLFLRMYLAGSFVAEQALNYNGLQNARERADYHQGAVDDLRDRYALLLGQRGARPEFRIEGEQSRCPDTRPYKGLTPNLN